MPQIKNFLNVMINVHCFINLIIQVLSWKLLQYSKF